MNLPRRVDLSVRGPPTHGRLMHAETDLPHEPEPGRPHRRARRRPRLERAERRAVRVVVRPGRGATGPALYGRKLWETMSSHWPTADQQPGATPAPRVHPLAGHAEGGVLLDDQHGRLEHPAGHRRRR